MAKLHQIYEDDLAELERVLPLLGEHVALSPSASPKTRTQLRRVREILSNVRWDYGPSTVEAVIPASDDPTDDYVRS